MDNKKNRDKNWLNLIVLIGGFIPLLLLGWSALQGNLGFNPVQTVMQRTGNLGMIFLILSLSCTPINKIFKLPAVGRLRKPLGLFAALYAFLHFAAFAIWDYQLNLGLIWNEIRTKPFIIFGAIALVILLILAATSFKSLQRKMGKTWVWLHRLVYVAGVLVVVHYLLSIKGDLFNLQGDFALPIIAMVIVSLLLMVRIPAFYQFLRHWFVKE
ncbi:MAG: putative membrane protein [Anaerolineaceae bacterium 46_22]|nr:MAG: putative membrane protein [Anaerolineaceae bacterium 46_22]